MLTKLMDGLREHLTGEAPHTAPTPAVPAVTRADAPRVEIYSSAFCPYCIRARRLLGAKNADYVLYDVDGDYGLRREMMERSQGHTVPQIFIGGKHIGGCDELVALERAGRLDALLAGT